MLRAQHKLIVGMLKLMPYIVPEPPLAILGCKVSSLLLHQLVPDSKGPLYLCHGGLYHRPEELFYLCPVSEGFIQCRNEVL